jgi:hypothetical protein
VEPVQPGLQDLKQQLVAAPGDTSTGCAGRAPAERRPARNYRHSPTASDIRAAPIYRGGPWWAAGVSGDTDQDDMVAFLGLHQGGSRMDGKRRTCAPRLVPPGSTALRARRRLPRFEQAAE